MLRIWTVGDFGLFEVDMEYSAFRESYNYAKENSDLVKIKPIHGRVFNLNPDNITIVEEVE